MLGSRRLALLGLLLVAAYAMGPACGGRNRLDLDLPVDQFLVDDPSATVAIAGRIGLAYAPSSVEVRIDGVDLIAALGLIPPFADESGVVMIGGSPVSISSFTFETGFNPRTVSLDAAGLPLGPHTVELEGTNGQGNVITRLADIEVIGPLTQELHELAAAGLPDGPESAATEGTLANATLGQPLAAPPVALSGGGELRPGFVAAAEARIQGGTP